MKIAVIGSRDFNKKEYLYSAIDQFISESNEVDISIISGGAQGADAIAKSYAHDRSYNYEEFKPDWKQFGRGAGPIRNAAIVEACDTLIAFWDGKSRGTQDAINKAKKLNKHIVIMSFAESSDI